MRNYRTGDLIIKAAFGILILTFIALLIIGLALPFLTQDTIVANVTGKEIYTTTSCDKDGCISTTHLTVYTDKEVIEISDSLMLWKFGEQQKYGSIEKGKIYKFKVWGFSVPMLQMYRSAYEFSEM